MAGTTFPSLVIVVVVIVRDVGLLLTVGRVLTVVAGCFLPMLRVLALRVRIMMLEVSGAIISLAVLRPLLLLFLS